MNYYLEQNQSFKVVSFDEPLKEHYLIRERYESPMMSQDGGWDTTYRSEEWRGTAWHLLKEELPGWVGKSYNEYLKFCDLDNPIHEIIELINIKKD